MHQRSVEVRTKIIKIIYGNQMAPPGKGHKKKKPSPKEGTASNYSECYVGLTQGHPSESGDFQIGIHGFNVLGDTLFGILDKILVHQGIVLEEPFQFSFGD